MPHVTIDREIFNQKYPPIKPQSSTSVSSSQNGPTVSQEAAEQTTINADKNQTDPVLEEQGEQPVGSQTSQQWFPAKSISRKRMVNKKLQFLVRWEDGTQSWESENDVTPLLKERFFIKMANRNRARQRQARRRF
jgi:hypothetical protein